MSRASSRYCGATSRLKASSALAANAFFQTFASGQRVGRSKSHPAAAAGWPVRAAGTAAAPVARQPPRRLPPVPRPPSGHQPRRHCVRHRPCPRRQRSRWPSALCDQRLLAARVAPAGCAAAAPAAACQYRGRSCSVRSDTGRSQLQAAHVSMLLRVAARLGFANHFRDIKATEQTRRHRRHSGTCIWCLLLPTIASCFHYEMPLSPPHEIGANEHAHKPKL